MLARNGILFALGLVLCVGSADAIGQQKVMQPAVQDVSLYKGHHLIGFVLSETQLPLSGQELSLTNSAGKTISVRTDEQGRFAFPEVTTGAYHITTATHSYPVRAWASGIAPKNAKNHFSNAVQPASYAQPRHSMIVRGQCDSPPLQQQGKLPMLWNKFRSLPPGAKLVGAGAVGLGVWGIVELADDDAPAS